MPPEEHLKGALFPNREDSPGEGSIASNERNRLVRHSPEHKQHASVITREKIAQGKPVLLPEMEEAALDTLRNDKFLRGENVFKFEEEFAHFVGTDYAVSTSSGTNALQFILISLGIKGKKVVTTPMSFIASANAIIQADGTRSSRIYPSLTTVWMPAKQRGSCRRVHPGYCQSIFLGNP